MELGVVAAAAEPENYLSLCDTLISLHPMRLCSALCANGSALYECRNVRMCEKDQGMCVFVRETKDVFLAMSQCIQANQTRKCKADFFTESKFLQKQQNFYQETDMILLAMLSPPSQL